MGLGRGCIEITCNEEHGVAEGFCIEGAPVER